MNDATAPRPPVVPVEPIFDRTPHPFGDGPVDPLIYDATDRALRQRTVNFAAKRYADMLYVSGLDRATADRHHRWRAALVPAGLWLAVFHPVAFLVLVAAGALSATLMLRWIMGGIRSLLARLRG